MADNKVIWRLENSTTINISDSDHLSINSLSLDRASKTLVSVKLPETEWVEDFTRTPPLLDMYQDYINPLIAPLVSEDQYELIKNMTSSRNLVAHKGFDIKGETCYKYTQFIKKLLYKIDTQLGYNWTSL